MLGVVSACGPTTATFLTSRASGNAYYGGPHQGSALADVVILYVGGKGGWYGDDLTEKEGGDTANIHLPAQQVDLVNAVIAIGKPTVAVVSMGRPQGLAAVIDKLPAVLTAYYGGRAPPLL